MRQLVFLLFFITSVIHSQQFKTFTNYTGYLPETISQLNPTGPFKDFKGSAVDLDNIDLEDLNHITTSVLALDVNGQVSGLGVTAQKDDYTIIYTFENYMEVYDRNDKLFRVGASIEIEVRVKTRKKKLNLSDLFSVAIQAERNKLSGSLTMTAKGFNPSKVYGLFNINSSIDKASIQQILKNVGILISKLSDKNVALDAVVLGHKSEDGSL